MEEIWREVSGREYLVSNTGKIKNKKTGRLLNPKPKKNGYVVVSLRSNGKIEYCLLHRLIAFSFPEICGEYFEGAQVDHKNRVRTDNRAENIHWVSPAGNINNPLTLEHLSNIRKNKPKSEEFKKKVSKTMTNNTYNKRWVIKLSKDNEILHFYPSISQAHRETGINNISYACSGRIKTAGGFVWKYAE